MRVVLVSTLGSHLGFVASLSRFLPKARHNKVPEHYVGNTWKGGGGVRSPILQSRIGGCVPAPADPYKVWEAVAPPPAPCPYVTGHSYLKVHGRARIPCDSRARFRVL